MTGVPRLELTVQGSGERIEFPVERMLNGGYAGRNQEAVWKHVEELAVIGVPAPARTPTIYSLGNNLAGCAGVVQVQHGMTSGEVEYVLLIGSGETYVTVGSDHTDRDLERQSVEWSKQAYPNVFAREVWRYLEVADHWDALVIRCWAVKDGERVLYQEGTLAELQTPDTLTGTLRELFGRAPTNVAVMSGTIPLTVGLVYGDAYEIEMHDPVLNRTIRHAYRVDVLREKIV